MPERKKDIFLTGAAGTIGSAIARRLSRLDYTLHLTSRKTERLAPLKKELAQEGIRAFFYALDLSDARQVQAVMRRFMDQAKRPYGLICNAGNLGVLGSFYKVDFKRWTTSFIENFLSQVQMIRLFAKGLIRKRLHEGAIIALSGAGLGGDASFENISNYSTAKAALTHFVEAVASECKPLGLTINAISPGPVLSGLTETAIRAGIKHAGAFALTAQRCKETGGVSPDLTAKIAEFLLQPSARSITGRLLSARFDWEMLTAAPERIAADPNLYKLRRIDDDLFAPRR